MSEKKLTPEETKKLLTECGREQAAGIMVAAIEQADDTNQAHNQMYMLQRMATHIMATMYHNFVVKYKEKTHDEFMIEMMADMAEEQSILMEESELVLAGSGKEDDNEPAAE